MQDAYAAVLRPGNHFLFIAPVDAVSSPPKFAAELCEA